MIAISRPPHNKYALHSCSNETYIAFVNGYSRAKKYGVRSIWAFIFGSGVYNLCIEALKGEVVLYGRRKLGSAIVSCFTYLSCPIVPLITNSTKLIRLANITHTAIAFGAETFEDCTNLAYLPLDLVLVGQPVPSGSAGRFNLMCGDYSLFTFED